MAKVPHRGQPIRSGPEFEKLCQQRWDQLRVTAEGAAITQTPGGFHIVIDQDKKIGFWTRLTEEAVDVGPGVYEHTQQRVPKYPEYDGALDEMSIFTDDENGVESYYNNNQELVYPVIDVNGTTGLVRDEQGNRVKNDDGSDKITYVWCWLGWDVRGDGVFLFDHQNPKDTKNEAPTVVGFLYTFQDRSPQAPTFIAQYRYSFPFENDPPISVDPATGDPLQDSQTGEFLLCGPGDYFIVTDDTFLFPLITTGCRGFATYDNGFDTWDCTFAQQSSILATAFINRPGLQSYDGHWIQEPGMDGDIEDVPIESFRVMGFSPFNGSPTDYNIDDDEYESPKFAYNAYQLMGMHGDRVLLAYDAEDEQWVIINVAHHKWRLLVTPADAQGVAMLRVKADGKTLEGKMVDAAIQINKPPEYKDVIQGTKCSDQQQM